MPVIRSKICGITRVEDALLAAEAGADAIGLVFYERSARHVTVERAAEIVAALPPFVSSVGLFVDAAPDEIQRVLRSVPLDLLQFHGQESPGDCRLYGRPYIKALRVRPIDDVLALMAPYEDARGFLLDTYVEGVAGGTGETFDWALIPETVRNSIILAGGLTPENVTQALSQVMPYAVDVSGGVELEKGVKSAEKVRAFVSRVRAFGI